MLKLPWEQRHFFDNIKKTIDFRGRTPKKLGMDWSKSGYLALSALNVKDGYIDYSADAHYANQKLYDKWMSGNNLVKGQVLFTTEAPMGNVAQVPDNKGYVLSQRTIAFVTNKDKITDDFLASILRTPQSFKRLSALSSGGTAKGVSQKSLSSFKLVIPPSLKEQEKIGKLFRSFEHTIYLHEEKRKQLEQLKKALLQKMFADKTNFPEIRFNGYVGPWEQRHLGNNASFSKGSGYSKADLREKGTPIILYGRLYTNYQPIIDKIDTFVEKKNGSVYSQAGDVIVPGSGETAEDISVASVVKNSGVILGGDLNVIHPNSKLDSLFLALSISNGSSHKDMARRAQGKSIVHLHINDLEQIKSYFPSIEEQKKIGQLFQSLDRTITLHDQKIEDLKQLKQALLQQMFI
jgi:type I restriction enzyme S subunit